ncbi:glycosyltransferase [Parasediminibacterium sp. JCM 36343]|uniref:glycosyltransferase n=1 Tax=Parasediminibacterium sp. JCM 36343 TaxID=3374279 RepID=UPI00397E597F
MTVLHIIPTMDPLSGGPCQVIRDIIPELEKINIKNEVVCFDNAAEYYISQESFVIHAIGKAKGLWQYNKAFSAWLENNLLNYNKVIIHALWLSHGYVFLKAYQKIKKKTESSLHYYIMPHGMLDPYFQNDSTRKLKAIRNEVYWRLIEAKVVNQADGLLFTCEQEMALARETFSGYAPRLEFNISLGIAPPPNFKQAFINAFYHFYPPQNTVPFLLFLSRIHEKKGVDLLLDAYEIIVNENDGVPIPNLVIAGPGADTEYGKMNVNKVTNSPALASKVFFTGMLTGDAKWGAYYAAQAFVLPSHQENFGLAVAEALACGKPVLITNKVNIYKEIIASNAGIAEDDTLEGIVQLLKNWLALSIEAKQTMSKNAGSCYSHHFTLNKTAAKISECLLAQERELLPLSK